MLSGEHAANADQYLSISMFNDGEIGCGDAATWADFVPDPIRLAAITGPIRIAVRVMLFPDGSRQVCQGHHRVCASWRDGHESVPVTYVEWHGFNSEIRWDRASVFPGLPTAA